MSSKTQIGVICRNAAGKSDVFFTEVVCTAEQAAAKVHFDLAMTAARAAGHDPVLAFDESDPLWSSMAAKAPNPYKKIVVGLLEQFSGLIVSEDPVSGGDVVEDLANFLREDVIKGFPSGTPMFIAMHQGSYVSEFQGGRIVAVTDEQPPVLFGQDVKDGLIAQGAILWELTRKDFAEGIDVPDLGVVRDAIHDACRRASDHDFTISEENVVEIALEEEPDLDVSPAFQPMIVDVFKNMDDLDQEVCRQRE